MTDLIERAKAVAEMLLAETVLWEGDDGLRVIPGARETEAAAIIRELIAQVEALEEETRNPW